jgi:hypothetical protein
MPGHHSITLAARVRIDGSSTGRGGRVGISQSWVSEKCPLGIDTLTNRSGARWHYTLGIRTISYARHRFPPDAIRYANWLYLGFTLSYRNAEDLLAERGFDISNETIRRWVLKFGPAIAQNLRRGRPVAHKRWHLDEMVVSIAERGMYI